MLQIVIEIKLDPLNFADKMSDTVVVNALWVEIVSDG